MRSMARWQKVLLVIAVIVVAVLGFMTWYALHFSMGVARQFEVNAAESRSRVLIATQGSKFKDAVVSGVVEHLRQRPAYVNVIDVSGLSGVNEEDWNAILVLHTWEMNEPPEDVQAFVARARDARKIIALSTSGSGNQKIAGVDAISSASTLADAPSRVTEITAKVDAILDASTQRDTTTETPNGESP